MGIEQSWVGLRWEYQHICILTNAKAIVPMAKSDSADVSLQQSQLGFESWSCGY